MFSHVRPNLVCDMYTNEAIIISAVAEATFRKRRRAKNDTQSTSTKPEAAAP